MHARSLAPDSGARSVVLDAGADLDAALSLLAATSLPVVVVVAVLDADTMRRLIEAGAADVMAHPVAPDVLGKKLKRLARRH